MRSTSWSFDDRMMTGICDSVRIWRTSPSPSPSGSRRSQTTRSTGSLSNAFFAAAVSGAVVTR
ncbi:hypothetical protein D3C72_2215600 [compost metagenome]